MPNQVASSEPTDEERGALKLMLSRFVMRLRLVAAHSLSTDRERLAQMSKHEWTFLVTEHGDGRPPEFECRPIALLPIEQLESAVARVRPLLLQEDGISYRQVLRRLGRDLNASERAEIKQLRERFEEFDPDHPHGRPKAPHEPGTPVSNRQLAGSWLYGSLVHADAIRQSYGANASPEGLQVEAQRVVAGLLLVSLGSLDFLRSLDRQGRVEIDSSAWTAPVVSSRTSWAPKIEAVHHAPVGTAMPESASGALGDEWSLLRPGELFDE